MWDMIGGHVETGETVEQALLREFNEEIGIYPTRFIPMNEIIVPEANESARLFTYRIDGWSGEPRLANDEHSELRWFGADITDATPLASDLYLPLFRSLLGL
jgi:8-oxo-dGTP diphosphatase